MKNYKQKNNFEKLKCLIFLVAAALNKIFFEKMGIFRFFVAADFNNINQFLKKIGLLIFLVAAAFNQKINFSPIRLIHQ